MNVRKESVPIRAKMTMALVVVILMPCVTGCRSQSIPTVTVSGASTLYPLLMEARPVVEEHYDVRLKATTGGSTRGIDDNRKGFNDFGAVARELTPEEQSNFLAFPVAKDGVVMVVHPDNPVVNELSKSQLRDLYQGSLDWNDFGWDHSTKIVSKGCGHATLEVFLKYTELHQTQITADVVVGDNAQVILAVSNSPGAIGYVSMGEAMHAIQAGDPLRLVSVDGIEPSLENVANGSWPMTRTLYLVSRTAPNEASDKVIKFFSTELGHQIIKKAKYVPVSH